MFLGNDSDKFPNLAKSLGGDSVQIKPDQIKPDQIKVLFPLGLKHNRLRTHAPVMFLGNDLDKFPNLSKLLGGDSVQIKPDQIKVLFPLGLKHNRLGQIRNLSKPLGGDWVQIKPAQIKKCCLPRFETQTTRNARRSGSSVMTQTNPKFV
jgi:hypothetical protein